MKVINGKTYYTTAEICKQFGISRNTWNVWRERFDVVQFTVGHVVLYPASELDRLLRENETRFKNGAWARQHRNKVEGVVDMDEVDKTIKAGIRKKKREQQQQQEGGTEK